MNQDFHQLLRWTMAKWNIKKIEIARMGGWSPEWISRVVADGRPMNEEFLWATVQVMEGHGVDSFEIRQIVRFGTRWIIARHGFDSFVQINDDKAWEWLKAVGDRYVEQRGGQDAVGQSFKQAMERLKGKFK